MRAGRFDAAIGSPDEQRLAGRIAGVMYVLGGVTASAVQLLPGVPDQHWRILLVETVLAVLWGVLCLAVIDFSRLPRAAFVCPGALALVLIAGASAATGGADSPARFFLIFCVMYYACFFPPLDAALMSAAGLVVVAAPLVYDGAAGIEVAGYVVLALACVVLGLTIARGKRLLVSARAEAEALALKDPLTDVANRRAMMHWLHEHASGEDGPPLGLVLLDLDGFKNVNTKLGYQMGDEVLCEAARTLQGCVRTDDLLARLGGDEFAVLVPDCSNGELPALSRRILEQMAELDVRPDLQGVRLSASVGWALFPRDAGTVRELVAVADSCLRAAKAAGKNRALSPVDLDLASA